MDRTERFYRIEQLLHDRKLVTLREFLESLEISRATFKRDIEYLRDRLHAPIEWDRDAGGYRFGTPANTKGGPRHELPGLWFNASEVHALLTMQHLLKGVEPGLLAPHVEPLLTRLQGMLASDDVTAPEVERRIKIIRIAARSMKPAFFEVAATATLKRRRLAVTYWSRYKDELSERELSPQRLVFYRGNWYLDAWCHLRKDIRSFALDGLRKASLLDTAAKNVAETELDEVLASGYGIISGRKLERAVLKFSPTAARWVAAEEWHPKQKSRTEPDGSYVLEFPYNDDQELVMDILRHGAEVEVLAPATLRNKVKSALAAALKRYR
jgi:predicted DNA-binding transcriptional regulator YafY